MGRELQEEFCARGRRILLLLFLQVVPQCTAHETAARSVAHKLAEARGHPIEAATRLATNACQLLRAAGVFTCELAVRCRCPRRSSNFELRRASIPQCWRGRICIRSWSLTSDCFRSTILHTSRPSLGCIFEDLRAPAWSACSADFVTSPCLTCMAHDASEVSHGAPNGLRDGVRASQGTARKEVDGRPKTVTAPARSFEQKWLRMR